MKTEQPVLITTIKAVTDLSESKNFFIGFNGELCGDGAKPLGVLNANTLQDEMAPVIASGIALVITASAIAQGDKLQSNEDGKAMTFISGEVSGYALDAAGGAGELIRVLLS